MNGNVRSKEGNFGSSNKMEVRKTERADKG